MFGIFFIVILSYEFNLKMEFFSPTTNIAFVIILNNLFSKLNQHWIRHFQVEWCNFIDSTSSWFFFVLALNHLLCFIPFSSSQVLNYNSVSTHIHPYTWNWLDVMALALDWRCCAFNPVIGPQLISLFSNQFSQRELNLSSKIRSVLNILT